MGVIMTTENQPYIYPLKTQKRKYIYISKKDRRNTKNGLENLREFYENVYFFEDSLNPPQYIPSELTTVQNMSLETLNAHSLSTDTSLNVAGVSAPTNPVLSAPPSAAFKASLLPPVNLSVVPVNVYATNGSHTVSLNVSFESYIDGSTADDYEILLTNQVIQHPGAITSITKVSNTITWNVVTSATNYVIETSGRAPILVSAPAANTTTVSYTFSPALSGVKSIKITPYNNTGISGTAKTVSLTF
jgi:hypothetical protein